MTVPFITTWSTEEVAPGKVIHHCLGGIAYADEVRGDRDENGVLWRRIESRREQGKPLFGKVHSLRQRHAMRDLLCQVCGQPADRTDKGTLWLLQDHRGDWQRWPESMAATEPPICLSCAEISPRVCPALRRGHVTVRVGHSPLAGIYGVRYARGGRFPWVMRDAIVEFDEPDLRWTVAGQLVRKLYNCTIVASEPARRRCRS